MTPRNWDDILDEDEHILWQGQPDPRLRIGLPDSPSMGLFLVFWLGTGIGWLAYAPDDWPFGVILLGVGAVAICAALIWQPVIWRRTWYSLSNKRAYIATDLPFQGKRLRSFSLDAANHVTLGAGALQTVNFATSVVPLQQDTRRPRTRLRSPLALRRHGFERLRDGEHVYHLIRDIQAGQYKDTQP